MAACRGNSAGGKARAGSSNSLAASDWPRRDSRYSRPPKSRRTAPAARINRIERISSPLLGPVNQQRAGRGSARSHRAATAKHAASHHLRRSTSPTPESVPPPATSSANRARLPASRDWPRFQQAELAPGLELLLEPVPLGPELVGGCLRMRQRGRSRGLGGLGLLSRRR